MIWLYRHTLSPLVGYNCRHLPTCSVYGDEAIERYGLWAGGWMTLARLLRCQPWGTSGIDNVRGQPPGARWYLPWRSAAGAASTRLTSPRTRNCCTRVHTKRIAARLGTVAVLHVHWFQLLRQEGKINALENLAIGVAIPARSSGRRPRFAHRILAAFRFYSGDSDKPSHTAFTVPSQTVRW